ncbi:MAG: hypothetical protein KAS05_04465 [Candidatus Omnitrophica bacterium]|nr:hypothetical protein [Candidatus Omnitrophota bacterium]
MYNKYKKLIIWVILIGIVYLSSGLAIAEDITWKEKKSKHFIIYYQEATSEYISQIIAKAEHYYIKITDDFGYRRYKFWLWEDRCRIYLYPDQDMYLSHSGKANWTRAYVNVVEKKITTFIWQDNFFDTILPHELAHIIFREFVGFDKDIPLCLDEGLACMQEKDKQERLDIAKSLVRLKLHISVEQLFKLKTDSVIIPFIFYSESASIVNFLFEKFGDEKFVFFCRRIRDGQDYEEALLSTYKFVDLEELGNAWIEYVNKD